MGKVLFAVVVFAGVLFAVVFSPVFVRRVSGFAARILTTRKIGIKVRAGRPEIGFKFSGATYLCFRSLGNIHKVFKTRESCPPILGVTTASYLGNDHCNRGWGHGKRIDCDRRKD